ncbi:MAG: NAD-dependent epimerase/dehydratase family protein [Myxococcota bacterium]
MKVLLTGGTGFLGSHIAQWLGEEGHEVRAMVRSTSDTRFLQTLPCVQLFEGAVEDRDGCRRAVEDVGAVIHCAGLVKARSPAEFRLTNVIGTQNILDAARTAEGVDRFVLVSSLAARAPSLSGRPLAVDVEAAPVTTYGRTKLEAERAVLACKDDLHVTVVRPTAIYGARDREMLQLFQYAQMRILPFIGDPQGKLTMIYGEDCARATIRCLTVDLPSGRAFDLDDGRVYSRIELAEGLESALGRRALVRFPIPNPIVRTVGFVSEAYGRITNRPVMVTREKVEELLHQWVGDSSSARNELGFEPSVDWREGARRTADWYFANGWL